MPKLAVCYIVHDDTYYLASSIASFKEAGEVFVFVSRVPWHDQPGDWQAAAQIARDAGAEVIEGEWTSELAHRQAALQPLLDRGYTHGLIPDGDEIIEPELLQSLLKIATTELADRVYVHWDTYWKTPEYVIRPREGFTPLLLVDLRRAEPIGGRNFSGGRSLLLSPDYGLVHHLSYVGPDERIRRKISTWGHKDEVQPGWFENAWLAWDGDKLLRDLHPTHPPAYGFAERIAVPDLLRPALARYRELAGLEAAEPALRTPDRTSPNPLLRKEGANSSSEGTPSLRREGQTAVAPSPYEGEGRGGVLIDAPYRVPARFPKVSVIIPLHGGVEDIRACLDSLEHCQDLLHEVIVIDNASPDAAADEAEKHDFVRLLRCETNAGFAAACNRGAAETTGDVLLFLNSDTIVPRMGLIRLVESLMKSGSIAASGPYTNRSGHFQQIEPTTTSLDTLDLFAEDFAARPHEDVETDMLVGFCLAVRKSVWEEVGGFDERFGLGTFEDNDLCYRIRRAGYRLVIAARSFIHHGGSQTLKRLQTDVGALLRRNEVLYRRKWQDDLETGYASHLSGLAAELIVFDASKHPDQRARKTAEWARRAAISLCMIVKNEERVLADALESARPFFAEMIVVDTGSTDRTVAIAEEAGAKVFTYPWPDSFSAARNESLRHACGQWVFWMDADDTLPRLSGEALLEAALNAPPEIVGFVVPVQFVEDGSAASGTRVDHVKLFRRLPGLAFEGRIHEQILPSLRKTGGQIARCGAVVLHSGYDTSPEGQAKKRERDLKLLALDLKERPNHPFVLFNLGMTHHYMGEQKTAIKWLTKCLKVSPPTDSHVRKAYALLALSQREAGETEACLQTLRNGLEAARGDPELHFHLGHTLTAQGCYPEAKAHYIQTLQADAVEHFSSVDIGILGFKTYHNLGSLCLLMGDYPEAKEWWRKAMEAAPEFLPSVYALFDAALEAGDLPTAQEMLEQVRRQEGSSLGWATLGARYVEALNNTPLAGDEFLRRAAAAEPNNPAPRLVLARRLIQSGREALAREHLLHLNALDEPEAAYFLGVSEIRHGNFTEALAWMERALVLNPGHPETQVQIANLRQAVASEEAEGNGG